MKRRRGEEDVRAAAGAAVSEGAKDAKPLVGQEATDRVLDHSHAAVRDNLVAEKTYGPDDAVDAATATAATTLSATRDPTRVLNVLELEELFMACAPPLDTFAIDGQPAPSKLVVGLVGYPNVGKSSTINALPVRRRYPSRRHPVRPSISRRFTFRLPPSCAIAPVLSSHNLPPRVPSWSAMVYCPSIRCASTPHQPSWSPSESPRTSSKEPMVSVSRRLPRKKEATVYQQDWRCSQPTPLREATLVKVKATPTSHAPFVTSSRTTSTLNSSTAIHHRSRCRHLQLCSTRTCPCRPRRSQIRPYLDPPRRKRRRCRSGHRRPRCRLASRTGRVDETQSFRCTSTVGKVESVGLGLL